MRQVGPDRMLKLRNVLEKVLGRFGTIIRRYYPVDSATQMFKGYIHTYSRDRVLGSHLHLLFILTHLSSFLAHFP